MEKKKQPAKRKASANNTIWISPSQWGVWRKCALSVAGSSSTLKVEADDYADAGTDLHAAIAAELLNKPSGLKDGSEEAAIVRFAVESTLWEQSGVLRYDTAVEHFMKVKFGNIIIGGTADCLIETNNTVKSIDHKTGWKEVEAEGNEQLKIYAHLAALENKSIKYWRGVIINARFNGVSYAEGGEIDPKYLKSIADDVKKRLKEGQHTTGHHCAYCPRLTTCAHIRKAITDWMIPGAIDSLTREPEKLSEALRLAKPAEKLFETIKKEAQLFMDLGGVIPGVTIEYSAGNRAFPSDMNARQISSRIGLKFSDMIEEKLITPTEALRRGADKDAVNAIVIRPPRKGLKFN